MQLLSILSEKKVRIIDINIINTDYRVLLRTAMFIAN